jgi:hypothetical protein
VWYKRGILGKRHAAEGIIYRDFAANSDKYILDTAPKVAFSIIGVDFGGNASAHAFNCTGYLPNMAGIVTLDEYYSKQELDAAELTENFVAFVKRQIAAKCNVLEVRADSEETVLIRSFRNALLREGIGIPVKTAIKGLIVNRIRFYDLMLSAGRYRIMQHCKRTIDAFATALWNPKKLKAERLDDGSTNIDSLDAQEYSTEPYQRQMQNMILD